MTCSDYYEKCYNFDLSAILNLNNYTCLSITSSHILSICLFCIWSWYNIEEDKKLGEHRQQYIELQQHKAKSACRSDLNELEILSQRENIKLAKEAADYVISPLLGDSSRAAKNKQNSEEDKAVINSVVAKANEVKNDLEKNVKPLTTEEIVSPSTEFINPIAKLKDTLRGL